MCGEIKSSDARAAPRGLARRVRDAHGGSHASRRKWAPRRRARPGRVRAVGDAGVQSRECTGDALAADGGVVPATRCRQRKRPRRRLRPDGRGTRAARRARWGNAPVRASWGGRGAERCDERSSTRARVPHGARRRAGEQGRRPRPTAAEQGSHETRIHHPRRARALGSTGPAPGWGHHPGRVAPRAAGVEPERDDRHAVEPTCSGR